MPTAIQNGVKHTFVMTRAIRRQMVKNKKAATQHEKMLERRKAKK